MNELYVKHYNPKWIQAWDGNMNIQVCLDFFAVAIYITDSYIKNESGTMKH